MSGPPDTQRNRFEEHGFRVGALVDHFRVLSLVGQGGMGAVFLAQDIELGRKVALKVILADSLGSDVAVKRFLLEARTTARFSHPNIVGIYAVGTFQGAPYVALEFVEGESLRKRIRDEPLPGRATLRIALSIAEGLAEAHAHGVTHRDLKPENIMIGRDGRLRVLDFGLATGHADSKLVPNTPPQTATGNGGQPPGAPYKADNAAGALRSAPDVAPGATNLPSKTVDRLTAVGHWVGTPAYMAPEQYARSDVGPSADIWALGVILHELVTGARPYGRIRSIARLALAVTSSEPVADIGQRGGIPPEIAGLVSRCLNKDPAQRPTASQVAAVIGRLVGGGRRLAEEENPFRGLLAFEERQASWYFGREREILLSLERLRSAPILPIVGPSGAGKSSLVQAGILPRVRELAPTVVVSVRPGTSPFRALATQLLMASTGRRPQSPSGTSIPSPMRMQTVEGQGPPLRSDVEALEGLAESGVTTDSDTSDGRPLGLLTGDIVEIDEPANVADSTTPQDDAARHFARDVDQLLETAATPSPETSPIAQRQAGADEETQAGDLTYESTDTMPSGATSGEMGSDGMLFASGLQHRPDATQVTALAEELQASPHRLNLKLAEIAESSGCVVVLLVDQLEEVFGRDSEDGAATVANFVEAIGLAADDPHGRVRVIFTLRDDFLGRVAIGPAIQRALSGVVVVQTPDAHALTETLEGPVRAAGYEFDDPELPALMVAAVEDSQAPLPLLQFTAALMWERRDRGSRQLTRKSYDDLGGVHGALATHAEGVLSGLAGDGITIARALLLRLVGADYTRRVRRRRDALDGLPPTAADILTRLCGARLLVTRQGDEGEPLVEIAHESLVTHWQRLRRWLEASSDDRALLEDLGHRQSQWQRRGSPDSELLRGSAVRDALELLGRSTATPPAVRRFVEASQRASRRGKNIIRASVSVVILALLGVAVFMFAQKEEAERERERAQSERQVAEQATRALAQKNTALTMAQARAQLDQDPTLAIAILKTIVAETVDIPQVMGVAQDATRRGIARHVLRGHRDEVRRVEFSPNNALLASASYDNTVRIWDLAAGTFMQLDGHSGEVKQLRWSPDGTLLLTGGREGEVRLWTPQGAGRLMGNHERELTAAAWSPDGRLFVTGSEDGMVRFWSPESGAVRSELAHSAEIEHLQWQADGKQLLSTAEDGTARLWPNGAQGSSHVVTTHVGVVRSGAISSDGSIIATGGSDGLVRVRHSDGRTESFQAHSHEVRAVRWNPQLSEVVTASRDGTVARWNLKTGAQETMNAHAAPIRDLVVSRDGRFFATGSEDKTAKLWRSDGSDVQVLEGHERRIRHLVFSPDSTLLATASSDGTVRVWPTGLDKRPLLVGHTRPSEHVVLGARGGDIGRSLAASSAEGEVRLWDLASGERWALGAHKDVVRWLAFDPGLRRLVTGSRDGAVKVWDVERRVAVNELASSMKVNQVTFAPDGVGIIAIGSTPAVMLWRTTADEPVPLEGHTDEVVGMALDRWGRLITGAVDRHVFAWDLATAHGKSIGVMADDVTVLASSGPNETEELLAVGAENGQLQIWHGEAAGYGTGFSVWKAHVGPIRTISVGSAGIATGGDDRMVKLWSRDGLALASLRGHRGAVTGIAFVGDERIVTSGEDGQIRVWDVRKQTSYELGRTSEPSSQMSFDPIHQRVAVNGSMDIPWWRLPTARPTTTDADLLLGRLTTATLAREGEDDGAGATLAKVSAAGQTPNVQNLSLPQVAVTPTQRVATPMPEPRSQEKTESP